MNSLFNRRVLGWGIYDFANSAFATTVLSVIFNVYFVNVICSSGVRLVSLQMPGETLWAYSVALSTLIVFLLGPYLGALADISGNVKPFLAFFTILGSLFTVLLYFCSQGDYVPAALCFLIANIGFSAGNIFYNALLPKISQPHTVGRISGLGWALGYAGGSLLLLFNLALIQKPELFHLFNSGDLPVRLSVASAGLWWAIFSLPLFLWVKETRRPPEHPLQPALIQGWKQVRSTFHAIRADPSLTKYMFAYLLYNDGIETLIVMASIFGAKALNMSQGSLIVCFLMIQFFAFWGSLYFGELADKVSHKRVITITLWIYLAICVWAYFMRSHLEFWILGGIVGLVLGGSQSASRSLLTLMIPPDKSAQFFGFFALAGKLSSVLGPITFGLLSQFFSLRAAILSLVFFFAAGLALLWKVKEPNQTLVNF